MTLLSICQQIAREVGDDEPSSIVGNSDQIAKRLLAVMQTAGRVLASGRIEVEGRFIKNHDWSALRKEFTFNTVASTSSYLISTAIGSDFNRLLPDTIWDRTNNWQVRVYSPEEWQLAKGYSIVSAQARISMIKRGLYLLLDPTPSDAYSIYGEYISKNWCQTSGGTGQTAWAADTDTGVVDEDLLMLEGKWRYLNRIGEAYAEEKLDAERAVFSAANADSKTTPVSITKKRLLFTDNIPQRVT